MHTVFLHEEDPKLNHTYTELRNLTQSQGLHNTPVIIGVRSQDYDKEAAPVDASDDDSVLPEFGLMLESLTETWVSGMIEVHCHGEFGDGG